MIKKLIEQILFPLEIIFHVLLKINHFCKLVLQCKITGSYYKTFGGYGKHRSTIHLEASSHFSGVRFYIKPHKSISLSMSQAIWLPVRMIPPYDL